MGTAPTKGRRVVKKTTVKGKLTMEGIKSTFRQFCGLRVEVAKINERVDDLKKDLSAAVEEQGYADDRGHIWFDLDEPIGGYTKLKRERRVSQKLIEDKARKVIDRKGLQADCIKTYLHIPDVDAAIAALKKAGLDTGIVETVEQIDEDEIMKAHYKGKITEREIDSMFEVKTTWAFVPTK